MFGKTYEYGLLAVLMHLSSENHTKVALDQTIVIVVVILFIFVSLDLNKRMYAVQTV